MKYAAEKLAGLFFFLAASQFIVGMMVAETQYPDYNTGQNYVSDLGNLTEPSAAVFNASIILLGLLLLTGVYFLQQAFDFKTLSILLILTAIGAIGVGVFTENAVTAHPLVSLIAFLFGALSSIASYKLLKQPFSIIAIILGLISLTALGLFATKIYLGLGPGGMERMIAYPILLWGAGFGGYLLSSPEKPYAKKPPEALLLDQNQI